MVDSYKLVIHGSMQYSATHTGLIDTKYIPPNGNILWDQEAWLDMERRDVRVRLDKKQTERLRQQLGIPNLVYGEMVPVRAKTTMDWVNLLKEYKLCPGFNFDGKMLGKNFFPSTEDFIKKVCH